VLSTIKILNRHVEQIVVERGRKIGTKKKRRSYENRAAKDWGTKPQQFTAQERSASHRSEESSTENRQVKQEYWYGKKNSDGYRGRALIEVEVF